MRNTIRSYHELVTIEDFGERIRYLQTNNIIGERTWGDDRYVNQMLYRMPRWKRLRREAILRDSDDDYVFDLAHKDFPVFGNVYVHHIEPITVDDILKERSRVFDLDNVVCTCFDTHQIIHFHKGMYKMEEPIIRKPFDTCPWR